MSEHAIVFNGPTPKTVLGWIDQYKDAARKACDPGSVPHPQRPYHTLLAELVAKAEQVSKTMENWGWPHYHLDQLLANFDVRRRLPPKPDPTVLRRKLEFLGGSVLVQQRVNEAAAEVDEFEAEARRRAASEVDELASDAKPAGESDNGVTLDKEDVWILEVYKTKGTYLPQSDVVTSLERDTEKRLSTNTVAARLKKLRGFGYIEHPSRKNRKDRITTLGLAALSAIPAVPGK
jgi:hypothetical protein